MNWYLYAKIENELEKSAGWKENITTALLSAILMIMSGSSIYNAIKKTQVSEEELMNAFNNEELMKEIKSISESQLQSSPQQNVTNEIKNPDESQNQSLIQQNITTELPSLNRIKEFISSHEEWRNKVYEDTEGKPTIGVGFHLTRDNPAKMREILENVGANFDKIMSSEEQLNDKQIMLLLEQDIKTAIKDAKNFVNNFDELPSDVKLILIDMVFNMGFPTLSTFSDFKKAIERKDFNEAVKEMIDSHWYNQTGNRSKKLVKMMQSIANQTNQTN